MGELRWRLVSSPHHDAADPCPLNICGVERGLRCEVTNDASLQSLELPVGNQDVVTYAER